jgi:HEAT repeat protein
MLRHSHVWQVVLLGLVIGCGEAPRSDKTSHKAISASTESTAAVDPPELEVVPSMGPRSLNAASRAKEVFAGLVEIAETRSDDVKSWARLEGELHELGLTAVPALAERLSDTNNVARELAAMFLAQLGPDASPAADGLLKLLDDDSTFARVNAAAALSTFEGHAARVTPVLTELLADADENVRITAATSLRNVGPPGREAVGALSRSLEDIDSRVRAAAATTLGELGQLASSSLSTLRRLDDDEDEQVRTAAARAIKRIDETARTAPVTIPASATE